MRDIHGRYHTLKEITEFGPDWARGCENCECGITNAPDLTGACSFYLERIVQALETKGAIFCGCRAGLAARSNLLNKRQALIEEARKDPRMLVQAMAQTHPDIEHAKRKVDEARAMNVPTIHFEKEVMA